MFETVVIATDASASAERAVATALDLAERFDAAVHVLSVLDDDDAEHEQTVRTTFARFSERTDRPVTTAVRQGDPVEIIVGYAERVDADVVATGTRGRDAPFSYHLGSVAEAVVRECPVPVLTVRELRGSEGSESPRTAE
ncbi:universal stress protein [Halomarina litorea]|uniref:universal stress protein n=1 Tax=Halomarina litorea TaxID=2961595 RepID=UPI0020C406D6|nr:universal stress protein [Halomarina sp. BCD28]